MYQKYEKSIGVFLGADTGVGQYHGNIVASALRKMRIYAAYAELRIFTTIQHYTEIAIFQKYTLLGIKVYTQLLEYTK